MIRIHIYLIVLAFVEGKGCISGISYYNSLMLMRTVGFMQLPTFASHLSSMECLLINLRFILKMKEGGCIFWHLFHLLF